MLDIGRICYKTRGRTQGDRVVIVETRKDGMAIIEGIHTKRKPCNPRHLLPTEQKIEIKKDATRKEIIEQLKS